MYEDFKERVRVAAENIRLPPYMRSIYKQEAAPVYGSDGSDFDIEQEHIDALAPQEEPPSPQKKFERQQSMERSPDDITMTRK